MRYLVLGANGMAGHVLVQTLIDAGHTVHAVARRALGFRDTLVADVKDLEALGRILVQEEYDVVVNCVGMLIAASDANPAEAAFVNAYLPQHIARSLAHTRTRFIHLSTDCVFSGVRGPYAETDDYDGQRFYDRSKALGEVRNNKDLTVRMSIIGPELRADGIGLFNWFMQQRGAIQGYTHAKWNGLTTVELARAVEQLAPTGVAGVVHLVPSEDLSKFDLLRRMNQEFERQLTIEPFAGYAADKRLLSTREDVPYRPAQYADQLRDLRTWVEEHAELYPHYDRGVAR